MKTKLFYIGSLFCVLFAVACNMDKALPPNEYAAFIKNPENGYLKTAQKGKLKIDCLYKPLDYEALSYSGNGVINASSFNAIKKDIDGNNYYELQIYRAANTTEGLQTYINYHLEKDLRLVFSNGDTIKPNSYMAEPYDGVSPFQRVLFSFPAKKENNDFTILIDSIPGQSLLKTSFAYTANTINTAKVELVD